MTTELADTGLLISAFGEDEAGKLYLAHHGGQGAIYLISASPSQRDLTGQIGQLTKIPKGVKDKLAFVITVQNVGDLPITVKSQVQVYLSADDTLDVSDILVFNRQVKTKQLGPGGIVTTKGKASVASPSQGQFLILKVDADNMVVESDEGNNLFILQIP